MAIQAHKLSKVFTTTRRRPGLKGTLRSLVAPDIVGRPAVEDVSFCAARGELLALLGPNGAGKSTTIKMLTGILTPTSGRAVVNGLVPYSDRVTELAILVAKAWSYRAEELMSTFGNYPLRFLSGIVSGAFTFVLPLAFVAYLPAAVLTGHTRSVAVSPASLPGCERLEAAPVLRWITQYIRKPGVNPRIHRLGWRRLAG